jgi:nucleoside phosphorylase
MTPDWRETLKTLLKQFEARAERSGGLNHLFVEVADSERDKLAGPSWFERKLGTIPIVDGKPQFRKWDMSAGEGLPDINPGFREPTSDETFDENESDRIIRDKSGVIRAVAVPMKLRHGFFCGQPSEDVASFRSLANIAATALAASANLHEHVFASDLTDLFRKPRGGVRYVFGEVPTPPTTFQAQDWDAVVLQYQNGVVIDVPISESRPDAGHWLLLLHRLGWRRINGCGLHAERWAWSDNVEVAFDMLSQDWSRYPKEFVNNFVHISRQSYYSVLGTKEAPLDVNLASVFAIQLLLVGLSNVGPSAESSADAVIDYSNEEWQKRPLPQLRTIQRDKCEGIVQPRVGVLVATKIELDAVLKRLRPPKNKRAVLRVHEGSNTCFLGRLGVTEVVLCMTAMGSSSRDASTLVTAEIFGSWNLPAVIMVGIAFGKDPAKQQIGTVLVSDRILPYEPQRIGETANEDRGIQHSAGPVLLNRFRNVIGWSFKSPNGGECGIQTGPILSGEKLVDNREFKRQLFERYPTAIGGEMEGAGVAASAERNRREWIVVKAICDWGDGTKTKQHQGFAAASSVDLVEHVLNQIGALDSLV